MAPLLGLSNSIRNRALDVFERTLEIVSSSTSTSTSLIMRSAPSAPSALAGRGLSRGGIAGISVGSVIGISIIFLVAYPMLAQTVRFGWNLWRERWKPKFSKSSDLDIRTQESTTDGDPTAATGSPITTQNSTENSSETSGRKSGDSASARSKERHRSLDKPIGLLSPYSCDDSDNPSNQPVDYQAPDTGLNSLYYRTDVPDAEFGLTEDTEARDAEQTRKDLREMEDRKRDSSSFMDSITRLTKRFTGSGSDSENEGKLGQDGPVADRGLTDSPVQSSQQNYGYSHRPMLSGSGQCFMPPQHMVNPIMAFEQPMQQQKQQAAGQQSIQPQQQQYSGTVNPQDVFMSSSQNAMPGSMAFANNTMFGQPQAVNTPGTEERLNEAAVLELMQKLAEHGALEQTLAIAMQSGAQQPQMTSAMPMGAVATTVPAVTSNGAPAGDLSHNSNLDFNTSGISDAANGALAEDLSGAHTISDLGGAVPAAASQSDFASNHTPQGMNSIVAQPLLLGNIASQSQQPYDVLESSLDAGVDMSFPSPISINAAASLDGQSDPHKNISTSTKPPQLNFNSSTIPFSSSSLPTDQDQQLQLFQHLLQNQPTSVLNTIQQQNIKLDPSITGYLSSQPQQNRHALLNVPNQSQTQLWNSQQPASAPSSSAPPVNSSNKILLSPPQGPDDQLMDASFASFYPTTQVPLDSASMSYFMDMNAMGSNNVSNNMIFKQEPRYAGYDMAQQKPMMMPAGFNLNPAAGPDFTLGDYMSSQQQPQLPTYNHRYTTSNHSADFPYNENSDMSTTYQYNSPSGHSIQTPDMRTTTPSPRVAMLQDMSPYQYLSGSSPLPAILNGLTCDECGRSFDQAHKLNHHKRYHERPHECQHAGCGKRFGTKTHLERHINDKHKQTRKYHCTEPGCAYSRAGGKGFPRKDNWRRHMTNIHNMSNSANIQADVVMDESLTEN